VTGILFLGSSAFSANADDAQQVLGHFKLVFRCHRILECFEFSRIELNYFSALGADHVIVVLMFVMVLVVSAVIAKANFSSETRFG
jgi:hypothetical protein